MTRAGSRHNNVVGRSHSINSRSGRSSARQRAAQEAAAAQEEAIRAAKAQIFEEAEQASRTRVADAEARGRAQMEEKDRPGAR
jgi:hypothetical protein